jgi:hypothetical protein
MRHAVLDTMLEIVTDDDASGRDRVAAAKVIVAADTLSQRDEHAANRAEPVSPVQITIGNSALKELPAETLDSELKALEEAEQRLRLASG